MKIFLIVEDVNGVETVTNTVVGRDNYAAESPHAVEQTGDLDDVRIGWFRQADGSYLPDAPEVAS